MTLHLDNNKYWLKVKEWVKKLNYKLLDEGTLYAIKVFNKELLTSKMIYYACARHLLFLYKEATEFDFPFMYRKDKIAKLIHFANAIIVPEINKPFIFMEFRKFMAGFIFGWVYKDVSRKPNDPYKFITNEIFDIEARKQWKSSFWAMISLAVVHGLLEEGKAEVYLCGPTKDSSKIPYDIALNYVIRSKKIKHLFLKWNSLVIQSKKRGTIKPIAFEKAALEGKNPSFVILTEYHLHKDDTMQESAKTSINMSRLNQMIVYDTTKGHNINGVCFKREKDYKQFLTEQIQNPETIHSNYNIFLWCAELDEDDYEDWKNPDLWIKANPGLDISVSLSSLKQELASLTTKQAEMEFQTKRLGMWVGGKSAYFDYFTVKTSNDLTWPIIKPYVENNFAGLNGIMGVDLSSIHDTTSVCLMWEIPQPDKESIWVFKVMGFIPADNVDNKEQIDKEPYRDWASKNFITLTPGKVIDYQYIKDLIRQWKNRFYVKILTYDRWHFDSIKEYLLKEGIFNSNSIVDVKQGVSLTPFIKVFERKLKLNKVNFLDNDYAISHILNTGIKEVGFNGNLIPEKIAFNKRIDAFASMLNCISQKVNVDAKRTEFSPKILKA